MVAISFSCEQKKQALIDHKCNQTIRPKGKREIKVGDKLTLYWHQREKQKCLNCLNPDCDFAGWNFNSYTTCDVFTKFSNVLGYGEVMEVFDISIDTKPQFALSSIVFNLRCDTITYIYMDTIEQECNAVRNTIKELAKEDGFETVWDFIKWFDTHYDLSSPKTFQVIRWKYLENEQ
jgi:hypothetical protein